MIDRKDVLKLKDDLGVSYPELRDALGENVSHTSVRNLLVQPASRWKDKKGQARLQKMLNYLQSLPGAKDGTPKITREEMRALVNLKGARTMDLAKLINVPPDMVSSLIHPSRINTNTKRQQERFRILKAHLESLPDNPKPISPQSEPLSQGDRRLIRTVIVKAKELTDKGLGKVMFT